MQISELKQKAKTSPVSKEVGRVIGRRKKLVGRLGEALIVKHLKERGFRHLDSNFLKKQGELDVILENEGEIHFFEVKTVSRENILSTLRPTDVAHEAVIRETRGKNGQNVDNFDRDFRPEENVNRSKLRKISRMIQMYLAEKGLVDREWYFHVAAVFLDQKNRKALIRFTKNVPVNG